MAVHRRVAVEWGVGLLRGNCASCINDEMEEFWLPHGTVSPKLGWLWTVIAVGYFESEPGILVLEKVEGSCFSSVESAVSVIQNPETQPLVQDFLSF